MAVSNSNAKASQGNVSMIMERQVRPGTWKYGEARGPGLPLEGVQAELGHPTSPQFHFVLTAWSLQLLTPPQKCQAVSCYACSGKDSLGAVKDVLQRRNLSAAATKLTQAGMLCCKPAVEREQLTVPLARPQLAGRWEGRPT